MYIIIINTNEQTHSQTPCTLAPAFQVAHLPMGHYVQYFSHRSVGSCRFEWALAVNDRWLNSHFSSLELVHNPWLSRNLWVPVDHVWTLILPGSVIVITQHLQPVLLSCQTKVQTGTTRVQFRHFPPLQLLLFLLCHLVHFPVPIWGILHCWLHLTKSMRLIFPPSHLWWTPACFHEVRFNVLPFKPTSFLLQRNESLEKKPLQIKFPLIKSASYLRKKWLNVFKAMLMYQILIECVALHTSTIFPPLFVTIPTR